MVPGLVSATDPPSDLARRIAERETETEKARGQYTYRQSLTMEEFDQRGRKGGLYQETRDVVFSPSGEREDKLVKGPNNSLKFLVMTKEDFDDLRQIQPALFTLENLRHYDTRPRGDETVDGVDCWVLDLKPKRLLYGQRFFEGMLWADKRDFSIVRMHGQAVPPVVRTKNGERQENLFPRFTTLRNRTPDGFWFPVRTFADDDLPFRTGAIRMRLDLRYDNYQRFGAESTIRFETQKP